MAPSDLNAPDPEPEYSGRDVLYRDRGVSALDVQRAADALLRQGQKPSVAAVRAHLGGGSPNTVGPLLDRYWQGLGTRLPAGPQALERVPESLARMTEALWLRSLDEARERVKNPASGGSPPQQTRDTLEQKVVELTAALAEARAKASETESELLGSLRERIELRQQLKQVTALLKAEQQLRMGERGTAATQARELTQRRVEVRELARRRLAVKMSRKQVIAKTAKKRPKRSKTPIKNASAGGKGRKAGRGRTRLTRPGHH